MPRSPIPGACLTVVGVEPQSGGSAIAFDVGAETLAVTNLAQWRAGRHVDLERSLQVGDELGGHMVSGHVDGIAEIPSRRDFDGMAHFRFRAPKYLAKFIAVKGSVALDGTSLTVNAVEGDGFEVLLIPHTLKVTTWGERQAGEKVNIEVDQMARYAARLGGGGAGRRLIEIRDEVPEDAPAGCVVMRRSIAELCEADHKNDSAILTRWLENKTVENFVAWINQPDNSLLVAVEDGKILAVGSVTDFGSIGLNYVSPDARFRGVSRALLRALEARAIACGNCQCTLTSTETARQFYLSNGYVASGAASGAFGTGSGYPMSKALVAHVPTS